MMDNIFDRSLNVSTGGQLREIQKRIQSLLEKKQTLQAEIAEMNQQRDDVLTGKIRNISEQQLVFLSQTKTREIAEIDDELISLNSAQSALESELQVTNEQQVINAQQPKENQSLLIPLLILGGVFLL